MSELKDQAWFMKYQPKTVDDLIFDSDEHKQLVLKWISNEKIEGNVLMYGKAGLGKTATAEMLINHIIKAKNDYYLAKDRSVKAIREEIAPFLTKRPMRSNQKIVYIEEMDKLSGDAFNELKAGLMEKYQEYNVFVCCTNYLKKVESAVLTRFTYKIPFSGKNIDGIVNRLNYILTTENAVYDKSQLVDFVQNNHKVGIRELINELQYQYISNNKKIDFKNLSGQIGIEEQIVQSILIIMEMLVKSDVKNKKLCLLTPLNSCIAEDYQKLFTVLHNNYDINYNQIFERLYESVSFIPVKIICSKYGEGLEFKKYPHAHLLGAIHEMMKCIIDISSL